MQAIVNAIKLLILSAVVSFSFAVCAAEPFEASTSFFAKEAQQAFVDELRKESIPFRVDAEGVVWYRVNDQKKIAMIQAKIINDTLVGSNAISYQNNEDADLFINALKQQNIPYSIKEENNRKFITWHAEDNVRVKEIEQSIIDKKLQQLNKREKQK